MSEVVPFLYFLLEWGTDMCYRKQNFVFSNFLLEMWPERLCSQYLGIWLLLCFIEKSLGVMSNRTFGIVRIQSNSQLHGAAWPKECGLLLSTKHPFCRAQTKLKIPNSDTRSEVIF